MAFMIGIQTDFQAQCMNKNGRKLICVDSTHGTNQYGFLLVTLLTIDDCGQGVPVAWFISNSDSQEALVPFFAALKTKYNFELSHAIQVSMFHYLQIGRL